MSTPSATTNDLRADQRDLQLVPRSSGARTPALAGRHRITRYGFWAIAALALSYAPLAINYMWRYFSNGTVQLQASVTSLADGHSYAVGYGSVDWIRATAYERDRWVMLTHTTLGGLCLILGIVQFAPAVRRRWPTLHRLSGRAFLVSMTICMLSAMQFLVQAGTANFAVGPAFWLQLWALAFGTLTTGWIAFVMIRRRNIVAHQGFMMLCFAMLMTAPGLRVLWISLHPLFPKTELIVNLGASAISEAILAPTIGIAAFILTRPRRGDGQLGSRAKPAYVWSAIAGLIATLLTVVHFSATLPATFPREMLSTYFVPLGLSVFMTLVLARRAHNAGRHTEERRWRMLFIGLTANIALCNLTWLLAATVVSQTDACLASLMVTAAIPILIAGAAVINDASPTPLLPIISRRARTQPNAQVAIPA